MDSVDGNAGGANLDLSATYLPLRPWARDDLVAIVIRASNVGGLPVDSYGSVILYPPVGGSGTVFRRPQFDTCPFEPLCSGFGDACADFGVLLPGESRECVLYYQVGSTPAPQILTFVVGLNPGPSTPVELLVPVTNAYAVPALGIAAIAALVLALAIGALSRHSWQKPNAQRG